MSNHSGIQAYGAVIPSQGLNPRRPYDHQRQAMHCLDLLNALDGSFSTMVVLPTGGGKTYTASNWLLRNAIGKRKKVLWIAHRHMLLDQAAESFKKYAYADMMPDTASFTYRIISGLPSHQNASRISSSDDLIIASKDSLRSHLDKVQDWLAGQQEMFLVVDEAHHATAKTYRNLIENLKRSVPIVKIIGLTATPFRTLDAEKGLLSKIFTDGLVDGRPVRGESGIAYQIGLQDLINRQILSRPFIETCETDEVYGQDLGAKEIESMQRLDSIPDKVANQMVESSSRNRLIVDAYVNNQDKYGQTILFAVNIAHAVTLKTLLNNAGVAADIVVSQLRDDDTGRMRTRAENQQAIDGYIKGEIKVLINVNILTEGVDLPKTKSVFLARPTSSTILMTQMIGRGLRGVKAGGTAESYIVSFVDGWDERVAWTSPETLFSGNNQFNDEDRKERERADLRAISISKIREFATILDANVDTTLLEGIPFIERIPVGMYVFSYTEQGDETNNIEGSDVSCQVIVYSSNQDAYERFVAELPKLVSGKGLEDVDFAPHSVLDDMTRTAETQFFSLDMVPPYRKKDIESILKYFVQFDAAPIFYTFDSIDREKLDVKTIAQEIIDKDMGPRAQTNYEDQLWDEGDDNILRLFFGNKRNFKHAVSYEVRKITDPSLYCAPAQTIAAEDGLQTDKVLKPCEPVDTETSAGRALAAATVSTVIAPQQTNLSDKMAAELSDMSLERLSFETLVPSEDVLASFDAYMPHGFAKNPITGIPIKKFGKHAKLVTVGAVSSLYSLGYLVAQVNEKKQSRLLSYQANGSLRNWSKPEQTLMHVADLLAYSLDLEDAPSFEQVLELARDAKISLSIQRIEVMKVEAKLASDKAANPGSAQIPSKAPAESCASKTSCMSVSNNISGVSIGVSQKQRSAIAYESAAEANSLATSSVLETSNSLSQDCSPQPSRQIDQMATPANPDDAQVICANGNSKNEIEQQPREKPKATYFKAKEEYYALPYAPLSGYARIAEKDELEKLNLHARIERTKNAHLLYSDQLLVAQYSDEDGLTLYEYGHGADVMGWFDTSHNADVCDFANRMLEHKTSVSTDWLRRESLREGSNVKSVRIGAIPEGAREQAAGGQKPQSSQSQNEASKTPAKTSPALRKTDRPETNLCVLLKNSYGRRSTAKLTIARQSVVAIVQAGNDDCSVFTKGGGEYLYQRPFWGLVREFAKEGFMTAEAGCMIRLDSVERIVNPSKPRVKLHGCAKEFPIGQEGVRVLLRKRPELKIN